MVRWIFQRHGSWGECDIRESVTGPRIFFVWVDTSLWSDSRHSYRARGVRGTARDVPGHRRVVTEHSDGAETSRSCLRIIMGENKKLSFVKE